MKKIILIANFTIMALSTFGQRTINSSLFFSGHKSKVKLKEHSGFIITSNNDTLYGQILLGQRYNSQESIRFVTPQSQKYFPIDDVIKIHILGYDSTITKNKYTDFLVLGTKPKLYRL